MHRLSFFSLLWNFKRGNGMMEKEEREEKEEHCCCQQLTYTQQTAKFRCWCNRFPHEMRARGSVWVEKSERGILAEGEEKKVRTWSWEDSFVWKDFSGRRRRRTFASQLKEKRKAVQLLVQHAGRRKEKRRNCYTLRDRNNSRYSSAVQWLSTSRSRPEKRKRKESERRREKEEKATQ